MLKSLLLVLLIRIPLSVSVSIGLEYQFYSTPFLVDSRVSRRKRMTARSARSEPLVFKLPSYSTIMTTPLKQLRHGSRMFLFVTLKVSTGPLLKNMAVMNTTLN